MRETTKNYQTFVDAMANISATDIVKLKRLYDKLRNDFDYEWVTEPFNKVFNEIVTDKKCPHCNCYLCVSDLPQYDYTCPECDENLYESEVK